MMAAFVVVLICSNIIGPAKLATIDIFGTSFIYGAGVLFFPLSYVFGDVLTEVYGYARARKVIWVGFIGVFFASIMSFIIVELPPAPGWEGQEAYALIFGQVPRIVLASMIAFFVGEMINAYVMAKMKVWTNGKHLWTRTIGSTIVGQGFDSLIFYPVAFYGIWSNEILLTVMFSNFLIKVAWEAILTPVTYKLVDILKKAEDVDIFDQETDFSPFKINTD
ncbi:MAG: queuosine precursor transporter [Kordiimonadaceae bacterium]|jgi:queuosine precursor transporter|nr:queuosine precursor transporter [Kordiimonadaceae bacterium]MBT6036255.1 queuosine precursor transporter [Kordiimonadaceae bacterium]MBT6329022.1 queuosine precursor transporter [Kordiimonadaceae bacterium]MBT7582203.1 queuosine precursor transporter [Kordiimonadaceae bacterium]